MLTVIDSEIQSAGEVGERPRRMPGWLRFWRSPDGQPPWARPALLAIAAAAAVLYSWNITESGYATYYSVAVKSMSVSWRAFFFGALDPGATITIDKLAGSFVPQALCARVFGYHQWSLTLPQVIEGVVAVLAMYRIGRRWLGPSAGLLSAGIFAFTPIIASMFGHPMEDGALTMCLVLAADAFQRAVLEGRLRSLALAAFWIGLGFQAKMLQAWMAVPAMAITYLAVAPGRWTRRMGHLSVAGLTMVAVSLSWCVAFALTPADQRPYVDGSTNNNAFSMVFGYNGLDRFGITVPGAAPSMFSKSSRPGGGTRHRDAGGMAGPGGAGFGAAPGTGAPGSAGAPSAAAPPGGGALPGGVGLPGAGGPPGPGGPPRGGPGGADQTWAKLVGSRYAGQVGWLYPLALFGLGIGLVLRRRMPRTDPIRSGLLLHGLWLATFLVVFSKMMIPHTAYLASLAPPLAALSAAGIVLGWRVHQDGHGRWALPLAIAVELGWTGYIASQYPDFLPWLGWVAVVVGVLGALILATARFAAVIARMSRVGLALGVAAMLAVPFSWAGSIIDLRYAGSAFDASAGPGGGMGFGGRHQTARFGQGASQERGLGNARNGEAGRSGSVPPGTGMPGGMPGGGMPGGVPGGGMPGGGMPGGVPGGGMPGGGMPGGAPGGGMPGGGPGGGRPGGGPGGGFGSESDRLDANSQRLVSYLQAHRAGARFIAATDSWHTAGSYIVATGETFMPMGGFSGSVPHPTLSEVKRLVAKGQLRYFLLTSMGMGWFGGAPGAGGTGGGASAGAVPPGGASGGGASAGAVPPGGASGGGASAGAVPPGGASGGGASAGAVPPGSGRIGGAAEAPGGFDGFGGGRGPGGRQGGTAIAIQQWVKQHCEVVPATEYSQGQDQGQPGSGGGWRFRMPTTLYHCSAG